MSGDRVYVVLVTAPPEKAAEIARALVESRVAACVNIVGGVSSVYWWEGRVEEAQEALLIAKTTQAALSRFLEVVRRVHPYEVPEAIALPVEAGLEDYLRWVRCEVGSDGGGCGAEAG